jgi:hypothetical protein
LKIKNTKHIDRELGLILLICYSAPVIFSNDGAERVLLSCSFLFLILILRIINTLQNNKNFLRVLFLFMFALPILLSGIFQYNLRLLF